MSSDENRMNEEVDETVEADGTQGTQKEIEHGPEAADANGGKDGCDAGACDCDQSEECEGDASCSCADQGTGTESARKGFFGKKKDKKDPKDVKIEELTDRLQRNMAEFDNYRKRTEKEKSTMFEIGAKDIIEKILPVVDNFERGLATISEEDKGTPFADGMDKIYKQLMKTLEDAGVKPIEAVGQPFDPNFHNAVMHIEDENLGENIIAQELMKGYTYREGVVRHSMVQVAN